MRSNTPFRCERGVRPRPATGSGGMAPWRAGGVMRARGDAMRRLLFVVFVLIVVAPPAAPAQGPRIVPLSPGPTKPLEVTPVRPTPPVVTEKPFPVVAEKPFPVIGAPVPAPAALMPGLSDG